MAQLLKQLLIVGVLGTWLLAGHSAAWAQPPDPAEFDEGADAPPDLPELAPLRQASGEVILDESSAMPGVFSVEGDLGEAIEQWEDHGDHGGGECGYCGRSDCPTCQHWYFRTDFVLLHRTRARPVTLAQEFQVVTNALGQQTVVSLPVLTSSQDRFSLTEGVRFTLGRYVGRDEMNRDHFWEASYLGFLHFKSADFANASARQTFTRPDLNAELSTPENLRPPSTFVAGTLFSRFDSFAPGFSMSDYAQYRYVSDLNDLQFTRRVRRGQRREQLVYLPGGWTPMSTPNFVPSLGFGPRFLNINEGFAWGTRGFVDFVDRFPFTGNYAVQTNNQLYGAQLTGDLAYADREWSASMGVNFGLFCNFSKQTTEVTINDATPFRNTFVPSASYANTAKTRDLSFVGEWHLNFSYQIRPRVIFRAQYGMMWVTGLALAPEQINFNPTQDPTINRGGMTVFQGGSGGLEFSF